MLHGSVEEQPAPQSLPARRRVEARAALELALRIGDLLAIPAMAVLSHMLWYGSAAPDASQRVVFGAVILSAIVCFAIAPVYRQWRARSLLSDLWLLLMAWSVTFALFSVYAVLADVAGSVPGRWLFGWYLMGLVAMSGTRVLLRVQLHRLRSQGLDRERVVLVGLRAPALKLHRLLRGKPELGKEVVGYFHVQGDIAVRRDRDAPRPLGELADLPRYLDAHRGEFDQLWVSLPMGDATPIKDMLKQIERFPVPVRLIPDTTGLGVLNPGVHQVGDVPMIGVRQGLAEHNFRLFKRAEDLVVAGMAVLLLLPLLAILALGVKLSSPGPVLFRQRRHGLGGKEFWMLKFRSMRVHEEKSGQITQATRDDPRVTRFGAFLRRSSLDELPQFFNVLGGSMSVVGPRPHAVQHNNHYERVIERYMHRHYVKPGITGWAQVHGLRGETPDLRSMKKRVQYDIDYIRRWSPTLDVRIIVLTALKVLGQKSAY
ncbi:undecaprenyl-phosphate glucose phosphotransferase [Stenotrophomonas sp. 24(2023)]|uniref:undecaprenyl-phosphate glucose phosphotransferase n=1 Tax=Stenotrophomonas sp. 24(2023) TaxID=3068324 RepID=UPI0027DFD605|nr:undecaprenyl-phosphate glucose phosphotransferase [Stenotrophomonas sp. 24(2023)]WMJ68974.1 undecaprenyl-phosphate glucose phosphotransferase [Stenotrophomonas sp. 24(2023)]